MKQHAIDSHYTSTRRKACTHQGSPLKDIVQTFISSLGNVYGISELHNRVS